LVFMIYAYVTKVCGWRMLLRFHCALPTSLLSTAIIDRDAWKESQLRNAKPFSRGEVAPKYLR
jgi:hypothetical protein